MCFAFTKWNTMYIPFAPFTSQYIMNILPVKGMGVGFHRVKKKKDFITVTCQTSKAKLHKNYNQAKGI